MKLTPLEIAVLKAMLASSRKNGHDFGIVEDCRSAVSKPSQLGGVVASLSKKGIIMVCEPVTTDTGTYTQFMIENFSVIHEFVKE